MKTFEQDFLNDLLEKEKQRKITAVEIERYNAEKERIELERQQEEQRKEDEDLKQRFINVPTKTLEAAIEFYENKYNKLEPVFALLAIFIVFFSAFLIWLFYSYKDPFVSIFICFIDIFIICIGYAIYDSNQEKIYPYKREIQRRQENNIDI